MAPLHSLVGGWKIGVAKRKVLPCVWKLHLQSHIDCIRRGKLSSLSLVNKMNLAMAAAMSDCHHSMTRLIYDLSNQLASRILYFLECSALVSLRIVPLCKAFHMMEFICCVEEKLYLNTQARWELVKAVDRCFSFLGRCFGFGKVIYENLLQYSMLVGLQHSCVESLDSRISAWFSGNIQGSEKEFQILLPSP